MDHFRTVGNSEYQHAPAQAEITTIGSVILAETSGRQTEEDITIFDSSGISVQDLYIGQRILEKFRTNYS